MLGFVFGGIDCLDATPSINIDSFNLASLLLDEETEERCHITLVAGVH